MQKSENIYYGTYDNFNLLMNLYEKNYISLSKLTNLDFTCCNNICLDYESSALISGKKIFLKFKSISCHTANIFFYYNIFSDHNYVYNVGIKLYFDSNQAELISDNFYKKNYIRKNIYNLHALGYKKLYKNYFLHIWLNNCLKKGYSFILDSKVKS